MGQTTNIYAKIKRLKGLGYTHNQARFLIGDTTLSGRARGKVVKEIQKNPTMKGLYYGIWKKKHRNDNVFSSSEVDFSAERESPQDVAKEETLNIGFGHGSEGITSSTLLADTNTYTDSEGSYNNIAQSLLGKTDAKNLYYDKDTGMPSELAQQMKKDIQQQGLESRRNVQSNLGARGVGISGASVRAQQSVGRQTGQQLTGLQQQLSESDRAAQQQANQSYINLATGLQGSDQQSQQFNISNIIAALNNQNNPETDE